MNVQVSICPHISHIPHLHPPTLSYVRWSRKLRTGRPVCCGGSTAEVAADETLKLVSETILDMLARLIQLLGGFDKLGVMKLSQYLDVWKYECYVCDAEISR